MEIFSHSSSNGSTNIKKDQLKLSFFLSDKKKFSILFYLILFQIVLFFSIKIMSQVLVFDIYWKFGSFHIPFISIKSEWMRFITGAFHHANFLHLTLNLFVLFLVGNFLEGLLGYKQFFILYFLISLLSSCMSYYFLYSDWYPVLIESLNLSSIVNIGLLIAAFIFLYLKKNQVHIVLKSFLYSNFSSLFFFNFFWMLFISFFSNQFFFDYGAFLGSILSGLLLPFIFQFLFSNLKWVEVFLFSLCLGVLISSFFWIFYLYLFNEKQILFWLDYY